MGQDSAVAVPTELMSVKQLPPLSPTASRLLRVVGDPDVEVEEIASIIEQDPGLTARILGLANSAYFGQARPIHRVQEAIIRVLGLNLVKSLSMGIAMAGSFDTQACSRLDMGEYWYQSLGSAVLGRLIAQRIESGGILDSDAVYLCGLLHQIGLLLLAHAFPAALSDALEARDQEPDKDLVQLEQRFLDTDHILSGEWLARRWHLPEVVGDTIAFQRRDDYQGAYATELCIVQGVERWLQESSPDQVAHLADVVCLKRLPGLDEHSLADIEERYSKQAEELRTLSRTLL